MWRVIFVKFMSRERLHVLFGLEDARARDKERYEVESVCVFREKETLECVPILLETPVVVVDRLASVGLFGAELFRGAVICAVHVPASVEVIGKNCFRNCVRLENVSFDRHSRLRRVQASAFQGTKLRTIELPSALESLGTKCFAKMLSSDISVGFVEPARVRALPSRMFAKSHVTRFVIPSSVEILEDKCFARSKSLSDVDVSVSVRVSVFSDSSFVKCNSLRRVTIPASLNILEERCFGQCRNLTVVEFPSDSQLQKIGARCFQETMLISIEIPSSVTEIGDEAFMGCIHLLSLRFRAKSCLTKIGQRAFCYCLIREIEIPESVECIGDYAFFEFQHPEAYGSLTFQPSNKAITLGAHCFHTVRIATVSLPRPSITMGRGCFSGELSSQFQGFSGTGGMLREMVFTGQPNVQILSVACFEYTALRSIIIPASVESISDRCFQHCELLELVTFSERPRLKHIGAKAFLHTRLVELTLPTSLASIGPSCFSRCYRLTTVHFPNCSLSTLPRKLFAHSAITSINVPSKIRTIDELCFLDCHKLETISFQANIRGVYINDSAFQSSPLRLVKKSSGRQQIEKATTQAPCKKRPRAV